MAPMKHLRLLQMVPRLFAARSSTKQQLYYRQGTTKLFGAKPGSDAPPGEIHIEDTQTALTSIDLERLRTTMSQIRKEINYETYDVSLVLVDDDDMQSANEESRGVNEPTDILSFAYCEVIRPGELGPPSFDIPDYYNLGDILIDVPYVIRSCESDRKENSDLYDQDDGEEDRGVSLAMSKTFDPEQRLHQLLVHGMLHLVGYDHEEEKDYLEMVEREEVILKTLGLF